MNIHNINATGVKMEVNGNQMDPVLIFFEDNCLYLLKDHIKLGLMRIQMTQQLAAATGGRSSACVPQMDFTHLLVGIQVFYDGLACEC